MANNLKRARGLFLQGLDVLGSGDSPAAEALFRQSVELDPQRPAALAHLAIALLAQHRPDEAKTWAEKALTRDPALAGAWFVLGKILAENGRHDPAFRAFEKAVAGDPVHADAWLGLGRAAIAMGRHEQGLGCLRKSLEIRPAQARVWLELGQHLQKQWQLAGALDAVSKAIALDPSMVAAWERQGALLLVLKREAEARQSLDQAVLLDPKNPMAWFTRGNVMQALDCYEDALNCYDKAIAADSGLDDAWSARASLYVSDVANVDRAIAESRRSWSSFVGHVMENVKAQPQAVTLQHFRLRHDLEQAAYLRTRDYPAEGVADFMATAERLLASAGSSDTAISPSAADWACMRPYLQAPLYYEMPQLFGTCLNPHNDWHAIEEAYLSGSPQLVTIDNFLSTEALAAFREFALVSKIWLTEYVNKYLGAFANRGFLSPLHLQLARELSSTMPRVFQDYRLTQLWGFKYDATMGQGINVHADFARVNLNFWLTPDEFNLDPASGGLKVYDVPSPNDWPYYDYNENEKKIYGFLADKHAQCVKVPYRCNRAVLFNSALFHETDEIHFQPGYESRRINFTYLFGRQL